MAAGDPTRCARSGAEETTVLAGSLAVLAHGVSVAGVKTVTTGVKVP